MHSLSTFAWFARYHTTQQSSRRQIKYRYVYSGVGMSTSSNSRDFFILTNMDPAHSHMHIYPPSHPLAHPLLLPLTPSKIRSRRRHSLPFLFRSPTQHSCLSPTSRTPSIVSTPTPHLDICCYYPMNKIVPVFRCANDRSHVLRKRDEKADQPGHYFAECSECRSDSTKKAEEEENESSNIGEEITNVKQLGTTSQPRTSDIPAHPTRGHGERTTQISSHGHHRAHSTSEHQYQLQSPPPPLQTINSPTRIPRLGMRNRNEILSPETRPVRQNLRSRLPSIDESYSRSTTPSYGTPPASSTPRKGLPLAILPVMVTETETDDESTMSCENSSLVGESSILEPPPIRLNRATRLGHFAQPTQAFLNRIVRTPNPVATATPSPRPPPSSKRPFISGIMQRGVQTSTQKTNMAGGRLPLQEVGQGIRIVGGTDSPRPSFGRGGGKKREAERRDSGNGNRHRDGERRAAKQRLLVFSRASLGE